MTQRILAATDLSAPSRHAVDRAYRLAAERNWPLTLLHAIPAGLFDSIQALLSMDSPSLDQSLEMDALSHMQALNGDPRHTHGVEAECTVIHGQPIDAIAAHAEQHDTALLVLGARGEGFLRQLTLGSTASRLVRKTRRPVLVVKQPPHEPYRQLLVPVDFSASSLRALRLARTIAPRADISVLHVFEVPFEGQLRYAGVDESKIEHYRAIAHNQAWEKLRQLRSSAELDDARVELLVRQGDVSQRILEQEQEADCDLIVIGKHGKDAIEELLLGRVTRHVLTEAQGDILVSL